MTIATTRFMQDNAWNCYVLIMFNEKIKTNIVNKLKKRLSRIKWDFQIIYDFELYNTKEKFFFDHKAERKKRQHNTNRFRVRCCCC